MRRLGGLPMVLLVVALVPMSPLSVWIVGAATAHAQQEARKRLILKDGTYQIVTSWKIEGDRVHYFSAERAEWEDVPVSWVDWAATSQWNKSHVPGGAPAPVKPAGPAGGSGTPAANKDESEAAEIDREAAAERAEQQARMPLVATGLRLPDDDGVWVLDNFQGIPELVQLHQSAGDVNHGGTHNVLRAAILSFRGAQEPVRLNGQAAKVRLHVNDPELYVSLDSGKTEQTAPESAFMVNTHGADAVKEKNSYSSPSSRYAIVRVDVQPGERVIGALRIRRVGQATQSEDVMPTVATILPGSRWMKLTPKEPLTVGEYALMEIPGPGEINLDVWDFGVSPNSPENRHPITPVRVAQP